MRLRRLAPIIALGLLAFAASLALGQWLFPHLSSNNDEAVYRFQAEVFRGGHLTLPASPYEGAFAPWMSAPREGRLVLVFQPIFPALLALGDLITGSTRMVLGTVAAAGVVAIYWLTAEIQLCYRTRLLATTLFALSPLAIIQSALYLEYLFATALIAVGLALVIRATRCTSQRLLVGAGLVYGILLFTRPLEALLLGGATAVFFAAQYRNVGRTVVASASVAAGVLPVAIAMLAYNAAITGHPLRFPLWAIGGNNAFGFGKRNIVAGAPLIEVTFVNALKATHQNLRSLPHWMFGSVVIVPLAVWGLWLRRREPSTWLLASIGVLFPLGYFFYWGNLLIVNGRKQIGPHYYLALLIPTVVFAATGTEHLYTSLRSRTRLSPHLAFGLVAAALVVPTAVEVPDKIDRNRHFTEVYRAEQNALDRAVANPAIVVLPVTTDGPYVLHPRGWLANDIDLRGERLYAADRGPANIDLVDRFPQRTLYRLQAVEASRQPLTYRPSVRAVQIVEGPHVRRLALSVPGDVTAVRAYLQTSPTDRQSCAAAPATELRVTLSAARVGLEGACGATLTIAPSQPRAVVVAGVELYRQNSAVSEYLEVRIPIDISGSRLRAFDADTWRIVPLDKTPARVIENDPALRLEAYIPS